MIGKSLIKKLPKIKSSPKKLETLNANNFWPKIFFPTKNWKKLSKKSIINVKKNIDTIKFLLNLMWEYFSKKK